MRQRKERKRARKLGQQSRHQDDPNGAFSLADSTVESCTDDQSSTWRFQLGFSSKNVLASGEKSKDSYDPSKKAKALITPVERRA
jgi:hypothetical protein